MDPLASSPIGSFPGSSAAGASGAIGLTTLDALKSGLSIIENNDQDVMLTRLIRYVSGRFDLECNRTFARAAGVIEEFNGAAREVIPARYPIEAVTSFHTKVSESEGWVLESDVEYLIRRACVISLAARFGTDETQAKVTYTGGYVLPGDVADTGQTALPAVIEEACLKQCLHWWQRRLELGSTNITTGSTSLTQLNSLDLLPEVRAVLKKFTRQLL